MAEPFQVCFVPEGRSYTAAGPTELFLAAASCGIILEQPCGSRGTCGNCRVRIVAGDVPPGGADRLRLSDAELQAGWRLACQLVIDRPATVEVPSSVRSLAGKSFGGDLEVDPARVPVVDVRTVQVERASIAVQESDLDRVTSALGRVRHGLSASPRALAGLRQVLGRADSARLVIRGTELVTASEADGPWPLGLALDIGSTSLAAALVDLRDGQVICSDSRLNPQVTFGADIIARIHYTVERPDGLERLTAAVRGGLRDLVCDLLSMAGRHADDVVLAACAGNPTMMHAWAGVAIAPLGTAPYVGAWSAELDCRASEMDLPIHPNAPLYVFPMVRSHVGSDAVAAAIAKGLDVLDRPTLLIDLGTNTEVMLASAGRFVA
ncbi:MAG: 2Fe-2S iron-sulfur cluster binding domain-containing protein, partial [Acidobacteria bacterium]|nr:2Fe-2S iron-sulfur cluster binding domain-containing protein [Acidobacteriota bacterium]